MNRDGAEITDRGPTLIIQVSKSVFKYGIKINAVGNNKELCSTLDSRLAFLSFLSDFTSAMKTIVLRSYCVKVEECKANQMHNK